MARHRVGSGTKHKVGVITAYEYETLQAILALGGIRLSTNGKLVKPGALRAVTWGNDSGKKLPAIRTTTAKSLMKRGLVERINHLYLATAAGCKAVNNYRDAVTYGDES
jgi:hypothetical protein